MNYSSPETFIGDLPNYPQEYPDVFIPEFTGSKTTAILGIGALTHDSSAALVDAKTGEILYASAEERFSNIKHDSRFPFVAISECLNFAKKIPVNINAVAVNFSPDLFLPSVLIDSLKDLGASDVEQDLFFAKLNELAKTIKPFDISKGMNSDIVSLLLSMKENVWLKTVNQEKLYKLLYRLSWYFNVSVKYQALGKHINNMFPNTAVKFYPHHDCHAATAWFGSGKINETLLVIDGHGEVDTTTLYSGSAGGLTRLSESKWPASIGAVYLAFTRYLGFDHGDEYKVMGMSAYGQPLYIPHLLETISVSPEGILKFGETRFFGIKEVNRSGHLRFYIKEAFQQICKQRGSNDVIDQNHFDLAASVQQFTEHIGVELATRAVDLSSLRSIALAGGVALNGLMNEKIRRSGVVEDIFIYPAASDDGTSAGAAMLCAMETGARPATRLRSSYFGNSASNEMIESTLISMGIRYQMHENINTLIAQKIFAGNIVSRYTGRSEYGPRALGNRSILANPCDPNMKDVLNLRIKHREQFRPFAPACLADYVSEYFEYDGDAPFMNIIVRGKDSAKAIIPAVIHSDGTARVQTVTLQDAPDFYNTLTEFKKLSGVPILINTSFNINGETIVDSPRDAIESFAFMDIDYLAIGDYWVSKADNRNILGGISHDEYLALRRGRYLQKLGPELSKLNPRTYESWFYPLHDEVAAVARSIKC